MLRLGLILLLSTVWVAPALAQDIDPFSEALSEATTGAVLSEAYMLACSMHDPDSETGRRDAMASWSHRVGLPGYRRVVTGVAEQIPSLLDDIDQHAQKVRQAVLDEIAADPSPCTSLAATLDEDIYDIADQIRYLLRNADDFGIDVPEPEVVPTGDEIEVLPLATLSAQLAQKMDEVGSKAGAREDRDLREAREDHAEAWLEQRPAVVIFGRVVAEDELREWRGDQQSAFSATCGSFFDDDEEASMAGAMGQDRIIVGEVRWLRDEHEGGVLSLSECRVFTHDPAAAELATSDDDSAGIMLRPPDYKEAFAGPGAGMAMGDIDRVLYDAEFENRMDGFGNGYTHRSEDIYVLLRDGTAYRHEWNFAFTDLDVELSRTREPDRWFTWRDSWGTVTVTQSGGLDAGTEVDLSDARKLVAVPQGQTLDQTYYYLNVGMGGSRRDRDYAFSRDGQLVHTRGGFVAGNFGTHYIAVVGDDDVTTSRYAFDGYTLLIEGPDGEERHFAAIFEGDDPDSPKEILIDGQVHWLREEDQ